MPNLEAQHGIIERYVNRGRTDAEVPTVSLANVFLQNHLI